MSKTKDILFSVILAFRNESEFLEECLKSFDRQTLSRELWEIILIDGRSTDGSLKIAENYIKNHNNSKLIDNPVELATAGWNRGIEASNGKYFCLTSGHSITDENYLLKAMNILEENENIYALGGRVYKEGNNDLSKSIAAATNTPFAMGGSYFRIGEKPKRVNSVGFGIYSKKLVDLLGYFDENLKRSGDWEFNYRVHSNGYLMYFDPVLIVKAFSRANYKSIFIQQFKTGYLKILVWAKHHRSLLPRHVIPSLFVLWLILIPLVLYFDKSLLGIWLIPILLYIIISALSTIKAVIKEKAKWYYVWPTYPVIHAAYGLGFICGLVRWGKRLARSFNKQKD